MRSSGRRALPARLRTALSALTAVSMALVGVVVTAPAARAAENGVPQLLGILGPTGLSSWTAGLGGLGKLAEPLPLVTASPGGVLGFSDLFSKAVFDELSGKDTLAGLAVDQPISIDGDRTGHLKTTVSDFEGGKKLDVVVTVDKSVSGESLRVSNASPKVELSVAGGVKVDVKSRLALSVVWTAQDTVHVQASPRLDVDVHASIDATNAAAAIGILGVKLNGSTVDIDAHFIGTVSDPDNDGKLAFGSGELGQDGSLEGLFAVGLDADGTKPRDDSDLGRGSVHATFVLGAAETGIPLSLPDNVTSTIKVDWDDIGAGAPVVQAPDLAATVGKFQNMSLQDLAEGLAQVIASITAIQKTEFDPDGNGPLPTTGDIDLPFMKGSLSDAVRMSDVLKSFLEKHTFPTPDKGGDPAKSGRPKFASLQELLKLLEQEADIALKDIGWDAGTSKFAFTATMTKTGTQVSLDAAAAAASGTGATYGPKTLKVPGATWSANQWLGRRVQAGTSAGEVESNTPDTITLKTDWIGGQPLNTTPYVISGAEAHAGAVTFANRIDDGNNHGISNANADQTFAKVTPSYTATVKLVLDLQDAKTGNDCIGFLGNDKACPFTMESGPLKTVVQSLPLNTDRVLLNTNGTSFSADFPIETKVDLTANAGFFKVRLDGTLEVCNSSLGDTCPDGTPTGHMLTIGLKQAGDAQHDIRLSELFTSLAKTPTSIVDVDVNVRAYGDMSISLPDAQSFLPNGATAKFTAKWGDLTNPSTIAFDTADLAEIFKLDFDANDPKALFTALVKTLQTVSKQLAEANPNAGGGVFDTDIPALGKSLRDLLLSDESNSGDGVSYGDNTVVDNSRGGNTLFPQNLNGRTVVVGTQVGIVKDVSDDGKTLVLTKNWDSKPAAGAAYMMRSALDDAADQLVAAAPDNIQDAVELLNKTLGTDAVKFRYLDAGGPHVVLDVNWGRDYRAASPIRLQLGNVNGSDRTFAGAQATGQAQVEVDGRIKLGLAIPLASGDGPSDGAALKVLEDSSISVDAKATLTNGIVKGVVGPLSIALGNPTPGAPADQKAQAKADLSVALAKSGAAANTPVTFNSFIGAVGVNFNATNDPVSCGEALTTKLMVCGNLPIYVNNSGADNGWKSVGPIALRVPDSTNPADLTDLNDALPAPDGAKKEFELPPNLATELANAILDFGNLGDGLESYLAQIETAFRTASFSGRLPLVGDDLQQGADFIGDLRSTLRDSIWNQLPGAGRPANATEFKNFINSKLADALASAGMATADLSVDFNCTETLHKANPPSVTPTLEVKDPPLTTKQWQYKVVAYQGSGDGTGGDTIPSDPGSANNAETLNDKSFNTVKWTSVAHASGYKILRKGPSDTQFKLLKKVGNALEHVDKGADTPTDYTAVGSEPKLDPCPLDFIDGVALEFTAQRGIVSSDKGCVSEGAPKPCIGAGDSVPFDIGIPGLALRSSSGAKGIEYGLGFALHFRLGLNKSDGFFINTHDGWGPGEKARPELQVGFAFKLPEAMVAELAFIKIDVKNAKQTPNPLFAGAFQIDLRSAANEASCFKDTDPGCTPTDAKLKFADLNRPAKDLFGISLTGKVDLDWNLTAHVDSAFPGIRANFQLKWEFDNKAPEAFGAPTIAFKNIGISAGDFFQKLLGDVVKEIKRVTGPLQPVVDTLYAPIPVLSDLSRLAGGDDVTLVTLAKSFSTIAGGPKLDFVDTIKSVIEFINRLPECDKGDDCFVPLGEFGVDGGKALNTTNSPTTAGTMFVESKPADGVTVKAAINSKNTRANAPDVFGSGQDEGDVEKSGFKFPILDNPASAFSLLMGGDVTLVEFDSGPLTLGFSWRQAFGPVYAPPPVYVTLAGSASVSLRIAAGLDTYGIRKAVEAVQNGTKLEAVDVLDGLFFKTVDDAGKPIPVVTLSGEIAAGAAVSAVIITVGIEGGLALTIGFHWNDPNDDGKFRVSEFLHAALSNPLCLFTTSGRLSLFLRVYITIGVSIFSVTFSFTLADVTLLNFSVAPDCAPPPPRLGGTVGDDTLVVYAGALGGKDFRGHDAWSNTKPDYEKDVVKVISLHYAQKPGDEAGTNGNFDGFAVEMLGERREYLNDKLQRVVIDGTGYAKPMDITFIGDGKKETGDAAGSVKTVFEKDAIVIGGNGDDHINTGTGVSKVDGGSGKDVIVTADTGTAPSQAFVAGGAHDDTITVGNSDDFVAGDASLGQVFKSRKVTHNEQDKGGTKDVNVVDWENLKDPTTQSAGNDQGADTIGLGLGQNKALGNGGDDKIGVASDAPNGSRKARVNRIVGGSGSDHITGGSAGDHIFTAGEAEFGVDDSGPADAGATNTVDTGTGSDEVWGSTGVDLVTSHSLGDQTAKLRGGSGRDVLIGGYGTDEVYGGPDDDYVIAEPATVSGELGPDGIFGPRRTVEKQALPAGVSPNRKTLVGGLGNDHVIGGDGPATIFGDKRIDAELCKTGDPVASDPVGESTSKASGDGNDRILGGAGVDTVSAGGADDAADLFGGNDLGCGQEGNDTLRGGSADDHLFGGTGRDLEYGESGIDHVFGNDGDDVQYGGDDTDVVEGNNGSDWATGGAGNDLVYGGTRAAGRTDSGGDTLYGDTGLDRLIGDNGTPDNPFDGGDPPAVPFDLDGATPAAGTGDTIFGGDEADTAYGGLGEDLVNGNNGNDHLEGNNAKDTVHGNAGEDEIAGGSFQESAPGVGRPDTGDLLFGDAGPDLLIGDNGVLAVVGDPALRTPVTRDRGFVLGHRVTLLDLGLTPAAGTSGDDQMSGGDGDDVLYGQGGVDRAKGDAQSDYVEGGQGSDWIEGDGADDDLVGGSSTPFDGGSGQPDTADAVFGGPGDDVAIGDNGQILRPANGQAPTRVTVRLGSTPGTPVTGRVVERYDLAALTEGRFGADRMSGGSGVDLLWGQDGDDFVSGGGQGDYLEGNGGNDVLRGDLGLGEASSETSVVPLDDPGWPGTASGPADLEGTDFTPGQDDMIGGSSAQAFRDGADAMEGNGGDDVQLGDNGSLVRTLQGLPGALTEKAYTERYPSGAIPLSATVSRTHDPALPGPSTRFCTLAQATCEPAGAFGADKMFGNDGDDGMWGQDGDDTMTGGNDDDDMLGELGNDTMFGNAGEDAMLGDRGGVVNEFVNADDAASKGFTVSLNSVPQESYTGFRAGSYDRRVDLLHDVDGDVWIGDVAPHNGIAEGGDDRMRGGTGSDNIHAGFGDDMANGDSGGDQVFGADGGDALWGGKGCDPILDAATPDCLKNGVFDPDARGTNDRFVDHVFGGVGGTSQSSTQGAIGSDVLDFNPRGSYPGNCAAGPWPATLGDGAIDPCRWFEMVDKTTADDSDNQHHQGTDWIYGGWDRDVLQGDVAGNGPNPGDRLMDWSGAYNLYTHCNAAYGGYNDIRQFSPAMQDFLQKVAYGSGAGRTAVEVTTSGTSAFRELALVYPADLKDHGNGKAYPTTPGHFDSPVSCID